MGTSTSWEQVSAKFNGLAREYGDLPRSCVAEGSLIVKKSVQGFMPDRLRGVGKNGWALNVRFDMNDASDEDASSVVYVLGPAQLIENDTRPHQIPKVRGSSARRRFAVIGGHPYSRVNHPGTKGKHPWAKGVEASIPAVERLFESKGELALRRVF